MAFDIPQPPALSPGVFTCGVAAGGRISMTPSLTRRSALPSTPTFTTTGLGIWMPGELPILRRLTSMIVRRMPCETKTLCHHVAAPAPRSRSSGSGIQRARLSTASNYARRAQHFFA